jgi:hypothetical protein
MTRVHRTEAGAYTHMPVKTWPVRMLLTLSRIPPNPGKRLHNIHILGYLCLTCGLPQKLEIQSQY